MQWTVENVTAYVIDLNLFIIIFFSSVRWFLYGRLGDARFAHAPTV